MNSLLSLPIDHLILSVVGIVLCLGIMFVCICRLNISETRRLRVTMTQAMFICFAFWAFGMVVCLLKGEAIGSRDAAAGLGIMFYLVVTYEHWADRERSVAWTLPENTRPLWMDEGDEHAATRA